MNPINESMGFCVCWFKCSAGIMVIDGRVYDINIRATLLSMTTPPYFDGFSWVVLNDGVQVATGHGRTMQLTKTEAIKAVQTYDAAKLLKGSDPMDPWTQKLEMAVVERDLKADIMRVTDALYPYVFDGVYDGKRATDPKEVMALWDRLVSNPYALKRLRGALANTGALDSERQFVTNQWSTEHEEYSALFAEDLLDRVRFGFDYIAGKRLATCGSTSPLEDIVQDVAMALLGKSVTVNP